MFIKTKFPTVNMQLQFEKTHCVLRNMNEKRTTSKMYLFATFLAQKEMLKSSREREKHVFVMEEGSLCCRLKNFTSAILGAKKS